VPSRIVRWLEIKTQFPRPCCPICGRPVKRRPGRVRGDGRWSAGYPTMRDVLIAQCPVHGKKRKYGHIARRRRGRW
jgi:hypothetical protein